MKSVTVPAWHQDVESWISSQTKDRVYLQDFLDAWRANDDSLARYAFVSLNHLFPPRPAALTATIFYAVRNALVFTPILATWYSLGHATEGFQSQMQSGKPEFTFLQYWQSLDGIHGFSGVATFDAWAIVLTVVSSLIISLHFESPTKIAKDQKLDEDMLAFIEIKLSEYRVPQSLAVDELQRKLSTSLQQKADHILDALSQTIQSAEASRIEIAKLAAKTADAVLSMDETVVKHVRPRAAELARTMKELDAAATSHGSLTQTVTACQAALAAAATQLTTDVQAAVSALATGTQSTQALVQGSLQQSMAAFQSDLRSSVKALSQEIDALGRTTGASLSTVEGASSKLSTRLDDTAQNLQAIARSLELTVLQVSNDVNGIRAALAAR